MASEFYDEKRDEVEEVLNPVGAVQHFADEAATAYAMWGGLSSEEQAYVTESAREYLTDMEELMEGWN